MFRFLFEKQGLNNTPILQSCGVELIQVECLGIHATLKAFKINLTIFVTTIIILLAVLEKVCQQYSLAFLFVVYSLHPT